MSKKIVVFGPGPQFKGGISNYTVSLAKALAKQGAEVTIVSWSQQYPAIIPRDFIDRKSKVDLLQGTTIEVKYVCTLLNLIIDSFSFITSISIVCLFINASDI